MCHIYVYANGKNNCIEISLIIVKQTKVNLKHPWLFWGRTLIPEEIFSRNIEITSRRLETISVELLFPRLLIVNSIMYV